MIKTKTYTYRDISGVWHGQIIGVEAEDNQFFEPKNVNSTEQVLSLMFELTNPSDASDTITHTQKFVAPLFEGKGLFAQLVTLFPGAVPGADFDEESLLGKEMDVELGKNAKGYTTVLYVSESSKKVAPKVSTKAPKVEAPKVEAPEVLEDLPWETEEVQDGNIS